MENPALQLINEKDVINYGLVIKGTNSSKNRLNKKDKLIS